MSIMLSDEELYTDEGGSNVSSQELYYEEDDDSDDQGFLEDEMNKDLDEQELSDENEIEDDESDLENDEQKLIIGSSAQIDIEKGKAVQEQISLYDNLLLTRIKLQKCLVAANRLPQYKNQIIDIDSIDNSQTIKAIQQFMESLLNCKTKILSNNSNFMKTIEDNSDLLTGKFKHKGFEYVLQEHNKIFKPYRNETIQFWNERTKLASGKAAKSDFSAFDQPTLSQIEQLMADKTRLIENTQTKRSKYDIVGNPNSIKVDVDQEIFDDDDFYHKLLRDYIERKSADVTDPSQLGKQWLQIQKLRSKMKRKIDTRSTKGRKLRYNVHTKLVNFMAPNDQSTWSEEAKQDLYNSLFGKKLTKQNK